MAVEVPETIAEAQRVGRRFTGDDAALQKYGFPIETWRCAVVGAGHKCAVYDCVDGWRLVRYCDADRACTETYEVPC